MEKRMIKIRISATYDFVKGGDCGMCELFDYCNDIDETDCEGGTAGHYEYGDNESIEQINDLQDEE